MKHFAILTCLIFIIGFSNNLSANEKSNPFQMNSSSTFKGYFYLGSDNAHHFFVAKWDYQKDVYFDVNKSDMKVNYEHPKQSIELPISLTNKSLDIFTIYSYGNEVITLYSGKAT